MHSNVVANDPAGIGNDRRVAEETVPVERKTASNEIRGIAEERIDISNNAVARRVCTVAPDKPVATSSKSSTTTEQVASPAAKRRITKQAPSNVENNVVGKCRLILCTQMQTTFFVVLLYAIFRRFGVLEVRKLRSKRRNRDDTKRTPRVRPSA